MATTTNYSWTKPTVGGDADTWGGYLNDNLDALDTLLGGVSSAEFSILDGATVTTAELNKLDGFTGTVTDLNYAKDLRATGVTTVQYGYLNGVTSNIQTQIDNITAAAGQVPSTRLISAGGGLTGGGDLSADRTISHADTSSQATVTNSGTTVIQSVTLDTYGHVTALASTTLTVPSLGTWTITDIGGTLYFARSGVNHMKIDINGNLTVRGNVTAYGTV